jgi:hypothetical protein
MGRAVAEPGGLTVCSWEPRRNTEHPARANAMLMLPSHQRVAQSSPKPAMRTRRARGVRAHASTPQAYRAPQRPRLRLSQACCALRFDAYMAAVCMRAGLRTLPAVPPPSRVARRRLPRFFRHSAPLRRPCWDMAAPLLSSFWLTVTLTCKQLLADCDFDLHAAPLALRASG